MGVNSIFNQSNREFCLSNISPYRLHWVNLSLHFIVNKLLQVTTGGVVYAGGHRQEGNGATGQGTEAILRLALHWFASLDHSSGDARLT